MPILYDKQSETKYNVRDKEGEIDLNMLACAPMVDWWMPRGHLKHSRQVDCERTRYCSAKILSGKIFLYFHNLRERTILHRKRLISR